MSNINEQDLASVDSGFLKALIDTVKRTTDLSGVYGSDSGFYEWINIDKFVKKNPKKQKFWIKLELDDSTKTIFQITAVKVEKICINKISVDGAIMHFDCPVSIV
jgi:hypothetical protein